MASLNVAEAKNIDQSQKDLVAGYFRQIQSLMNKHEHAYYDTPPLVVYLTILYYYIREYFTKCGVGMKINETGDKIDTISLEGESTAYGNIEIDGSSNRIYRWKIKIMSIPQYSPIIAVGIDSSNKKWLNRYFYFKHQDSSYYVYKFTRNRGFKYRNSRNEYANNYGHGIDVGDIITMELDTNKKMIRFYHNGEDQGIAFENIDFSENKKYHMAVFLYDPDICLQLIDFRQKICG